MRLRPGLELCRFCCVCLRRTLQYSYVLLAWRHASAYLWLCTRLSARLLCSFVEDHTNVVHRNIHLEKFVSLAIHLIWGRSCCSRTFWHHSLRYRILWRALTNNKPYKTRDESTDQQATKFSTAMNNETQKMIKKNNQSAKTKIPKPQRQQTTTLIGKSR